MYLLFDLRADGYQGWGPAAILALGATASGIGFFLSREIYERGSDSRRKRMYACAFAFLASSMGSVLFFWQSVREYNNLLDAYNRRAYQVIDGQLSAFSPSKGGHGPESFYVSGRRFSYWPASNSAGFRESGLNILQNGHRVRIFTVGGDIIRFEIQGI
jgi:hypothetical protein